MTRTAGSVLAAPFLVVFLSVAAAADGPEPEWKSISVEGLTVRYTGPSDVLARQVLEKSITFLEDTSRFFGLEAVGPYHIVIAPSREQFAELQPTSRPAPEWAGALTYPALGLVLIMTPGAMETGGTRYWSLLQHEMAHLLLGDAEIANSTRLPRWFQEGLATYVAGEMTLPRLFSLGWAQASGSAPAFSELEFTFPRQPALAGAAYARSYLFIRYLTTEFGDDSVARLLKTSLESGGIREGVRQEFGMSLARLLQEFDRYARFRAMWVPAIFSTASLWAFITVLFLFTSWRKRVATARTLERWDDEEVMALILEEAGEEGGDEGEVDEEKPVLH